MPNDLVDALANVQEQEALALTQQLLDRGTDPAEILTYVRDGMDVVGKRFEDGEYFLPELVLSGEIVRRVSDMVKPALPESAERGHRGTVVIGTVQGDIHDLGKNLVVFMLDVSGFEVVDLGVDVPPSRFVDAVRTQCPQVVGLSGLLTLAYEAMRRTVAAIRAEAGSHDVRIMIGGGHITDTVRQHTGADAWGKDAMAAVRLAKGWIEGA